MGFKRLETPWTVSEKVDNITRPADRIAFQLKHNDKCLVASGEQSFLYLLIQRLHSSWQVSDGNTLF